MPPNGRGGRDVAGGSPKRALRRHRKPRRLNSLRDGPHHDRRILRPLLPNNAYRPIASASKLQSATSSSRSRQCGSSAGRLATAGNRLAILSNTNRLQWEFISDGHYPLFALGKPTSAFDWAILSYEVEAMKPDRAIYDAAIQRAGVAATKCFSPTTGWRTSEGARAVGIDAVQFVDSDGLVTQLRDAVWRAHNFGCASTF